MKTTTVISATPAPGSQFLVKWVGPELSERITIDGSDDAQRIWRELIASQENFDDSKEHMVVIGMDVRRHFLGWHLVAVGTANGVIAPPRDILRAALAIDSVEIMIMHNHPSGVVFPSKTDEEFTQRIADACRMLHVSLLDHVIVNSPGTEAWSIRGGRPDMFTKSAWQAKEWTPPAPVAARPASPHARKSTAKRLEGAGVPNIVSFHS